jgi:exosortase D (VPLPA-CTERM-specific)
MNSFRIGAIGVTVEHWGQRMAEGLLHDFEGWVVFMLSTIALLGVAALLTRLGTAKSSLRDALSFDTATAPARPKDAAPPSTRAIPQTFIAAAALAASASISAFALPPRAAEAAPRRTSLVEFPSHFGNWEGRRQPIESVYLDALKLDDYVMADYRGTGGLPVNFYVAYYDSQRKGHSVHSPRSCIPGGGWVIRSFEQKTLSSGGKSLPVNRAVIELGQQRQIVYYWFQQRGRAMTNEYLVKWFIFWDALTRNRTDGALVRFSAPVAPGMDESRADAEIAQFAAAVVPQLQWYIPD